MGREILTRQTLGLRDLFRRHLVGEFCAIGPRFEVALHRRKVEPFVRGDQIENPGLFAGRSRQSQSIHLVATQDRLRILDGFR